MAEDEKVTKQEADDYDAGFEIATDADQPADAEDSAINIAPESTDAQVDQSAVEEAEDKTVQNKDQEDAQGNDQPEGLTDVEQLNKRLADTQRALTRVSQERSELRRLLQEQQAGRATQQQVDEARDAVQQSDVELDDMLEQALDEYPELRPLLTTIASTAKSLQSEVATLKRSREHEDAQRAVDAAKEVFDATVKPKILAAHPDYESILLVKGAGGKELLNEDYFEWAEQQSPALKFAALESAHPDDIIYAVSEYKRHKGITTNTPEQLRNTKQKILNAQTLRGGSVPFPVKTGGQGDDYDSGYDLAVNSTKA